MMLNHSPLNTNNIHCFTLCSAILQQLEGSSQFSPVNSSHVSYMEPTVLMLFSPLNKPEYAFLTHLSRGESLRGRRAWADSLTSTYSGPSEVNSHSLHTLCDKLLLVYHSVYHLGYLHQHYFLTCDRMPVRSQNLKCSGEVESKSLPGRHGKHSSCNLNQSAISVYFQIKAPAEKPPVLYT